MTVAGEGDPQQLIRRNGAKAGDLLYTTGEYGLTGIGLQLTLHPEDSAWTLILTKKPALMPFFIQILTSKLGRSWRNMDGPTREQILLMDY